MCNINVSIIVPVYNVEAYIEECLRSVMAQTYINYECLIVDDCGPDNSILIAKQLVAEYDGPAIFRIIHRERNGGLSAARNTGLHEAVGEYVYFLDSDDKLFPHSIEVLVRLAQKYPGVDMVQGNIEIQNGKMQYLHFHKDEFFEYLNDRMEIRNLVLGRLPETAWNKLVRRIFLLSNNLFFVEGIIHEDGMWKWHYQKEIQSLAVCAENTYWYRTDNQQSIMAVPDRTNSLLSHIAILREMLTTFDGCKLEKVYILSSLSSTYKSRVWAHIGDKSKVMSAIRSLNKLTYKMPIPFIFRFQLYLWTLPNCILDNKYFAKLNYEIVKYNRKSCEKKR